jgi:hypothetical protein
MQAEAVADLIDAVTPLQARAAFDRSGHAHRGDRRDRCVAVRFDREARSVDRLSRRGYHFVAPTEIVTKLDALVSAS